MSPWTDEKTFATVANYSLSEEEVLVALSSPEAGQCALCECGEDTAGACVALVFVILRP